MILPFTHHPKTHSADMSVLMPKIEMARELRGAHGHVLTPGRYVGAEEIEDDGVPFEEKMAKLSAGLYERMPEAEELNRGVGQNLEVLGYGE